MEQWIQTCLLSTSTCIERKASNDDFSRFPYPIVTVSLLAALHRAVYNLVGITLRPYLVSIPLNFFDDPSDAARPPDEVRITEVRVDPLPDGRRVVVSVTLTPFLQKPSFDVTILRDGIEERSLSVVGAMQPEAQLTMHLPAATPGGSYLARVDLLGEGGVQQSETVAFKVP